MRIQYLLLILLTTLFLGCDSNKLKEIPIEKFMGTWELQGRTMFDGIVVEIKKSDNGEFVGKVNKLNDNKYVEIFAENGDIWVTNISRSSNYEFKITEKKIASPLFALYGQGTTAQYEAQFIDDNTIGLAISNSDPTKSSVVYKRITK